MVVYNVKIRETVSFAKYVTVCSSQERQSNLLLRKLYCTTNYSLTLKLSSCMKRGSTAGICCKAWIKRGCTVFHNVYVYLEADNHCGIKSPQQLDTEADTVALCRLRDNPTPPPAAPPTARLQLSSHLQAERPVTPPGWAAAHQSRPHSAGPSCLSSGSEGWDQLPGWGDGERSRLLSLHHLNNKQHRRHPGISVLVVLEIEVLSE